MGWQAGGKPRLRSRTTSGKLASSASVSPVRLIELGQRGARRRLL